MHSLLLAVLGAKRTDLLSVGNLCGRGIREEKARVLPSSFSKREGARKIVWASRDIQAWILVAPTLASINPIGTSSFFRRSCLKK